MTSVKTILLTRPEAQSRRLADEISKQFPDKTRCLISPLLTLEFIGQLPPLAPFQAIVFTSSGAIDGFLNAGGKPEIPCYCVGNRTADTARKAGFQAYSANGVVTDLAQYIQTHVQKDAGPLLYIHGAQVAGDLAGDLKSRGFGVQDVTLYQQLITPLTMGAQGAFAAGQIDFLPLYSPRTARELAHILREKPDWPRGQLTALCLSNNIAREVEGLGLGRVKTAIAPNHVEIFALLGRFLA